MERLEFDGRVVIITGGARGLGRAHALLMAARGARVVVCDTGGDTEGLGESSAPAIEVVKEIEAGGGTAIATFASVASADGAASVVGEALDAFGQVDALINNAGIVRIGEFDEASPEDYQHHLDVHFFGTLHMSRATWPHLARSGVGRIVNTVSAVMLGLPKSAAYGSAKAATFGLTRHLALAGLSCGINVNAIAPGARTRLTESAKDSLPPGVFERVMANARPEDVAPVAAYLAHQSCSLTGEVLNANGGSVSRMVVMDTPGISDPNLTPEVVAARLSEILDTGAAVVHELTVAGPPPR